MKSSPEQNQTTPASEQGKRRAAKIRVIQNTLPHKTRGKAMLCCYYTIKNSGIKDAAQKFPNRAEEKTNALTKSFRRATIQRHIVTRIKQVSAAQQDRASAS